MKRILSLLLVPVMIVLVAPPAAADDDDDDRDDERRARVELLTRDTAAVVAGDTAWVALNWTAEDAGVSDFAVELRGEPGDGIVVTYPTNTETYTGLMNGHVLDEDEIDFTALRVHVPASVTKKRVNINLEVSYTDADGDALTQNAQIRVPVAQYTDGDHVVLHEADGEVAADESGWIDVDITGLAPLVDDIRLTVDGPLPVAYPADGPFTSLHADGSLEDGETDTARFRVDAAGVAPGTYELTAELSYTFDGDTHVRRGPVQVVVAG